MKSFIYNALLIITISLSLLTSCAKEGFQTVNQQLPNNDPNGNNGGNHGPPNASLEDQIRNLDMSAYLFTGPFPIPEKGLLIVDLNKGGDGLMIVRIPLGITPIFTLGAGVHQKYKDITFTIAGSISSGFSLLVAIPLKYILHLAKFENAAPGRLPNGDPLPDVPSGELPMLSISVNPSKKEKIYLYLSKEYLGVLFESKFDPGVDMMGIQLKDKNDLRTVGYIHVMKAKNNAPAAFMLSMQFPPKVAALLDDYFMN